MMKRIPLAVLLTCCICTIIHAQQNHIFSFGTAPGGRKEFMLDGRPFQIISGEMHPARIPKIYWRHRIQMAKAMGCNTIAVYVFWNYHESAPGVFDFTTDNRDIAGFIKICQQEGLWVLLRPGPYVCAEWDWGGLPPYLLKTPDIKIRCMDARYMAAVQRYVENLSKEIASLQCTHGGPILMVQVENEYGSYSNDKVYTHTLKNMWVQNGIDVSFYTADGPAAYLLQSGSVDGCAIGLDSGTGDDDFAQAEKQNPDVPAFSSETYPGWLTHWGEVWQRTDTGFLKGVRYLLEHKRSFNLYVVHGGTNFGFTTGANSFNPTQYQPVVTSYDYDAPINEQGQPTYKYYALRNLISKYVSYKIPDVPAAIPAIDIPAFTLHPYTSVWNILPTPIATPQPVPMESLNQSNGFIVYRTTLVGPHTGKLTITEPHDFALVFLDGTLIDTIYRDGGKWTITLPETNSKEPMLDILVENLGHINFAQYMIDRKGITDRVTLNGITLTNWQTYTLPMDDKSISSLTANTNNLKREGVFFKGTVTLNDVADTYFDMSNYKMGVIWVNGHNLGRYWYKRPQKRLYCPAAWLKKGDNTITIFDLFIKEPATIYGAKTLE